VVTVEDHGHARTLWRVLLGTFALGAPWLGWRSFLLFKSASEVEDRPWLDFEPAFRLFGGLIGLALTALMVVSLVSAGLIDVRAEWWTGKAARFSAVMSTVWMAIFGIAAFLGSLVSLGIFTALFALLTVSVYHLATVRRARFQIVAQPPPPRPEGWQPPPPTPAGER